MEEDRLHPPWESLEQRNENLSWSEGLRNAKGRGREGECLKVKRDRGGCRSDKELQSTLLFV